MISFDLVPTLCVGMQSGRFASLFRLPSGTLRIRFESYAEGA
ncbi:Uncharacterized protein dnm_074660 [Desulfonema magnum]|uniref:Uncharacterized protein n=1 Tax=Desulfonema magnum TaxID=45655 RepID=A0A975BTC3_9BACT|nr:Uncharacterized protein dnm_074660 [Desulfonema magnum]